MQSKAEKKKLCKFKQNCPAFIAKQPCGFDHVQCKFKDICKDKSQCRFYHKAKPVFDKPKQQTECKFGASCTKPGCPFKHQQKQQNQPNQNKNKSLEKFNKPCYQGAQCKRPGCAFQHPKKQGNLEGNLNNMKQQSTANIPNLFGAQPKNDLFGLQNQHQHQPQPFNQQKSPSSFVNAERRQEDRYCLNFMINNSCSQQQCGRLHEFTQKTTIKRVFFTTQLSDRISNITFFSHNKSNLNADQAKNNKQVVYLFIQNDTIQFKKLISAQNFYEKFGGIGSNQPNHMYLAPIKQNVFKAEGNINGIDSFCYQNQEYLVFCVNNKIVLLNITKGQLHDFDVSTVNNKLIGCTLIQQHGIFLAAISLEELKCFQFNRQSHKFQLRSINQKPNCKGFKKFQITNFQLLGQKIIYGIDSQSKKICFMNTSLKPTTIDFPTNTIINDAEVCMLNNGKTPVCLISTTLGGRNHQIVALNLLSLEQQTIMKYDFNSGLNKLFISEGQIFVEIKNKGLLIYKLGQFEKQIGMIPLLNEVQSVKRDNKGNVLIHQSNSAEAKGSLGIYRVKKV